ncbi:hypothetical protein [Kordiimonas pumila]|uniref:Flagellar protein FliL n=1 Tax=Kordiimonas pumila TaxID=2161677 RepID=A0ABV7D3G1_9PROT|nr:hypothetical protein [Kordiimonas pumila]
MAEETTVEPEGGSSKVFLVLGLILGVGLGGGAGYYLSASKSEDDNSAEAIHEKEEKKKEPIISIPFENMAVPIYATRNSKRIFVGNYFVNVNVQVRGETRQIAIKRSVSQLTHGFISAISKSDLMDEENRTELDMDKAATILKQKADSIMGNGIVESVTITEAIRMPR